MLQDYLIYIVLKGLKQVEKINNPMGTRLNFTRLQRLFMSSHTAGHMKWYKTRNKQEGALTHPSDGEEWKRFDLMHPSFAKEIRKSDSSD
ncbi:hypothetical protein QQ045_029891 [Rhodiola kirilowii]